MTSALAPTLSHTHPAINGARRSSSSSALSDIAWVHLTSQRRPRTGWSGDSRRPGGTSTQYESASRGRLGVTGGSMENRGPLSENVRLSRITAWVIGLGVALGTLSGVTFMHGETPTEYPVPAVAAASQL